MKINIESKTDKLLSSIGLAIMALATIVGTTELPSHNYGSGYILPGQTVKFETNASDSSLYNPIRREKEETASDFLSFGESQRTPSRSGKY